MSTGRSTNQSRGRRTFTDAFKQNAVNLVLQEGYSFKRAAEAVGDSDADRVTLRAQVVF